MKNKKLPFHQIERWVLISIFLTIILTNVLNTRYAFPNRDLTLYFAKIFIPLILFLSCYFIQFGLIPEYLEKKKKVKPILLTILIFGISLGLTAAFAYGADIHENVFLPVYFGSIATYLGYLVVVYMLDQILLPPNLENYGVYNAVRLAMIYLFIILFLFQAQYFISSIIPFTFVIILPGLVFILIYSFFLIYQNKRAGNHKAARLHFRLLIVGIILVTGITVLAYDGHPLLFAIGVVFSLITIIVIIPFSEFLFNKYEAYLGEINSLTVRADQSTANLSFLRSQINPHFLFNILNTLYGAALQENAEKTASGIQKLGDMMRFMLHENTQEKIPIEHEKDYLINYVDLQELRIKDQENITLTFTRPESPCKGEMAPMLLIPFIENAFKHGISMQKKSWVNINLRCLAGSVHLDVTNSIHRANTADPEYKSSGIGLENVRQRLKLLYPGKYELIIRENDTEYFVHLSIQL
jgi:two-component system LytT family sensor kinase